MNTNPLIRRSNMTRRQFLASTGALGVAGLSLPALLAACGGDEAVGHGHVGSEGGC